MTISFKGRTLVRMLVLGMMLPWQLSSAGPLRDLIVERRAQRHAETLDEDEAGGGIALPDGVRALRDIVYGDDPRQRFDVYLPKHAEHAPVIFMVHGGGWRRGDKTMKTSVQNKMAHWTRKGFIFVSTDYRLLPQTKPVEQAQDVARALAAAQAKAASWGGDPARFILIGHSAGAHLAALIASSPTIAPQAGASPWLGTISLDSATLDVEQSMSRKHMRLYDPAFGSDPAYWKEASPYAAMQSKPRPILAVCSSRRDDSCPQAHRFAEKATSLGGRAQVLEEDMSHKEINDRLGQDENYTQAVEGFLGTLDPAVAARLRQSPPG